MKKTEPRLALRELICNGEGCKELKETCSRHRENAHITLYEDPYYCNYYRYAKKADRLVPT